MTAGVVAFDETVPLHHQVYLQLRQEIADGLWVSRNFPSELNTAERFGVSVMTSRTALDRLARDGWLTRQRGRGTTVTHQAQAHLPGLRPPLIPGESQRTFQYRVLSLGVEVAPATACAVFGMPIGSELWQCRRLRLYEGQRHSVTHNAQLPEIGLKNARRDLGRQPMSAILNNRGIKPLRMRRRISVTCAPPLVADHLGLTVVDPVLVTEFTIHGIADRPIEWVRIYLHPEVAGPEETMDLETGVWTPQEMP